MTISDNTATKLVLSVNAGSSSLKAALVENGETHIASFLAERLETEDAVIHFSYDRKGTKKDASIPNCNHEDALQQILDFLKQPEHDLLVRLVATGHRVVHGGATFTDATIITEKVLQEIEAVSHLAPLHNPHNIKGIRSVQNVLPHLPAIAVFDTAFHSSLPPKASTYPLPESYRDKGIRKYGFHGTSVRYVSEKANQILQKLWDESSNPKRTKSNGCNMIVCHLGNGASVTAVNDQGQSVETSMGFSPLAGLMMGTRAGSIDPAIVSFAVHSLDKTVDDVLNDLNKESGLKAMTKDHDYDMRSLLKRAQQKDEDASLAVDMFVYRLVQHIASSMVALPGPIDAIIFTAGIGEHSSEIRRRCAEQLQTTILPQLSLDEAANNAGGSQTNGVLTKSSCWPVCLDIATDEEVMIAKDCLRLTQTK
ncbi:hypothetical protein ACA910_007854 [Epithemia clementina (nom. ined.)]